MYLRRLTTVSFRLDKNQRELAVSVEIIPGILLMDNAYRTKKTLGDRAIENVAPKVWNRLPLEIRQCQSLNTFKVLLKTHLSKLAFY